jgi:3-oxoacyl-[acyl-carrier protein] reductase
VIYAALPELKNSAAGRIINVSSVWGIHGASCEVAYSAAKAGIIGLTKALAKELGPSGITVNCVAPGYIDTEMNARFDIKTVADITDRTPLSRTGTAGDVAGAVLWLASAEASFVTGTVLGVDGGFM